MLNKIFLILGIFAIIAVIPIANAQFSMGVEAYQKSIQLTVDENNIIQAKHVIGSSTSPVRIDLFEYAEKESIKVTNEDGEELEFGKLQMEEDKITITILHPIKTNAIIKYNLENVVKVIDNTSIFDINYPKTFSILFPEKIELIFINNNLITLGDKKGISINGGGDATIQYYSEIPKIIEEIRWEENKFNIEIITDSKIDGINFDQTSKSISFQINEKNKMVTIILPEELLWGPYAILLNDESIEFKYQEKDENYVILYLNPQSTGQITIIGTTVIPEFSMFLPLIMGFLVVLTIPFMKKINLR